MSARPDFLLSFYKRAEGALRVPGSSYHVIGIFKTALYAIVFHVSVSRAAIVA